MKITIVGTGYVGLVTGTCFADCGNHVCCLDIDPTKVALLKAGKCTIYEPGLEELIVQNSRAGRLTFTTDIHEATRHGEVIFLCVGTPPSADGSADLSGIEAAARSIAEQMQESRIVVIKSTVPVGTGDRIETLMRSHTQQRVDLVSNPEFLKEGAAVRDFRMPDRVVIGAENPEAAEVVRQLYLPFTPPRTPILMIGRRASEMSKYAANSYLAMRISFINEMANICERVGVDIDEVKSGMATDARIGSHFLYPGVGYGGSCFPKDVQALAAVSDGVEHEAKILKAVHDTNELQKRAMFDHIRAEFGSRLDGKRFAVWGVTFKSRTDDIRESPALTMIELLLDAGAWVTAYDPQGLENLAVKYAGRVHYARDAYTALDAADALIVLTDWDEFRSPDFERIAGALRRPIIFDGRNLYKTAWMRRHHFTYYSIGRPPVYGERDGADRPFELEEALS
ncbi:MAG TPA: UDP-glucose/GDP-mannose dehydrogenase family protein [Phycisphaerae bacterium]|nr:UDP-glucose/GDP-mannose dehydrogenase family protein [Phycisphaerae bacterium]HRW54203.1 UDP-glucose/GDP-mannose dehydrogenase family protein [Phycisphaerae bacterium]